jgi:DHA1 family bicyclomycin/chloramphenicol resistance-like MFS transporter
VNGTAGPGGDVQARSDMAPRETGSRRIPPAWLLVAITSIGPFSLQILLPALPGLARSFAVAPGAAQLALTFFLAGVAIGQLLYGPLSDHYGRRPFVMLGLALFLVSSLGAAAAGTIGWLIAGRMVQAVGACSGMVLARAMIRDCYPREKSASVMAYVFMGMTVAPMVAPVIGGAIEQAFGWRAIFGLTAAAGVVLLAAVLRFLPETLGAPQRLPGMAGFLRANLSLLRRPAFAVFAGSFSATSGVFFAFLAGAPFVVVNGLGLSPTIYGLAFIVISLAYAAGNFVTARYAQRLGVIRLLILGTTVTLAGAAGSLAAVLALPLHIATLFGPAMLMALGNGVAQANAMAGAVSVRPKLAGTASGLAGALQMAFGAVMTVLVGATETGSGVATASFMLASSVLCQAFIIGGRRRGAI